MTKFDRLRIKLKTGWGLDLFRGEPGNHYAWRIERLLKPEID